MNTKIAYLTKYLKKYSRDIFVVLSSLIIVSIVLIAFGYVFRIIIDTGISKHNISLIKYYVIALCGLILLFGVGSFLRSFYINNLAEKVVADIKVDIFCNLLSNDLVVFENLKVSELISSLVSDTKQIASLIINFLSFFIRNSIMLVSGLILMFIQSPILSLTVILIVPTMLFPLLKFLKKLRKYSKIIIDKESKLSSSIDETFSNISTVHSFNQQSLIAEKFQNQVGDFLKSASQRLRTRSAFFALSITIILLIITLIIWMGIRNIADNQLSNGQMISFLYYAVMVSASAAGIAELVSEFHGPVTAIERLISYDKYHSDAVAGNVALSSIQSIVLSKIKFFYPSRPNIIVLNDFSIEFPLGKFIGIVGKSGSGKTTIMQLLMRFYYVNSGDIKFPNFGYSNRISIKDIRSKISYAPQHSVIFSGTIKSNILFSNPQATAIEVDEVVKLLGINEFTDNLAEGIDTDVGESGIKLSGGQKQRIAIARALLYKPEILLLDEATNALDIDSESQVIHNIRRFMRGKTVIAITHRIVSIEKADIIFLVDNGKLAASGTHQELLTKSDLYKFLSTEQNAT